MTPLPSTKKLDPSFFPRLWDVAHEAGMIAVAKLNVVPMVVTAHANSWDDNSPV